MTTSVSRAEDYIPKGPISRLVLHFDVNKTLVMLDPAGGKNVEDIVNEVVAEWSWGVVSTPEGGDEPVWNIATTDLQPTPANKEHISYKSYVFEHLLPFPEVKEGEDWNEVDVRTKKIKRMRTALVSRFTLAEQAGASMRHHYDRIFEGLIMEPGAERKLHFVMPAFYDMLLHLVEKKIDFDIVFRTFGDDIVPLRDDFNRFCEGRHPWYSGVRLTGENGSRDLRLYLPENSGVIYREGLKSEDTALIFGTIETAPLSKGWEFYANKAEVASVNRGYRAMYDALMRKLEARGVIAVRDYFSWWSANAEMAGTGKVVLLDKADTITRHIFFDDNIRRPPKGLKRNIVDPRCVDTGETLPVVDLLDKALVIVEPVDVILNRNYFIEQLRLCLGGQLDV